MAGARVLVLEQNARSGTKILVSGGGHCNVTTTLDAVAAEAHFVSSEGGAKGGRFLRHALRTTPPAEIRRWLEERGVATVEREFEKVWPASMRARDVRDALVGRAVDAGARIRTRTPVCEIGRTSTGWCARAGQVEFVAPTMVLAVGGKSYPKAGTRGVGYAWLRALDLEVIEPVPALAPLASPAHWVHALAGMTLEDVELRLQAGEKPVFRRRRPLLFTHRGISGPAAMDASGRLERAPGRYRVLVDLVPDVPSEALAARLFVGGGRLLPRIARELGLPRRLGTHILQSLELEDVAPAEVNRRKRRELLLALKGLEIPISSSLGFDKAEVTAGGLALGEVDPKTMQVRRHPGLFVTGELLDVDGPIGGFSFLVAFATGALAGRAAASQA